MQSNEIRVDIGCGLKKPEGFIGIDVRDFPGVDYVMNVGKEKLPFKDNSVDVITSIHVFEHFYPEELFFCIEECFRVLKPTGFLHIEVPKAGTRAYYIHPDHKLQFTEDTFGFFQVPGNEEHRDPHGYLTGFWHIQMLLNDNPEAISVNLFPNKQGGRYPFVKVLH